MKNRMYFFYRFALDAVKQECWARFQGAHRDTVTGAPNSSGFGSSPTTNNSEEPRFSLTHLLTRSLTLFPRKSREKDCTAQPPFWLTETATPYSGIQTHNG